VGDVARLDRELRERMLEALLAQHPTAMVVAIDASGLFAPMPAAVPLTTHRRIHGVGPRSVLDMVVPADRPPVIDAWLQADAHGAAQINVRLVAPSVLPRTSSGKFQRLAARELVRQSVN